MIDCRDMYTNNDNVSRGCGVATTMHNNATDKQAVVTMVHNSVTDEGEVMSIVNGISVVLNLSESPAFHWLILL
jgi:hypothetical protein